MFRWENAIALHKPWEIMDIMKGDTKVEEHTLKSRIMG
jgi:hypothetical protein